MVTRQRRRPGRRRSKKGEEKRKIERMILMFVCVYLYVLFIIGCAMKMLFIAYVV